MLVRVSSGLRDAAGLISLLATLCSVDFRIAAGRHQHIQDHTESSLISNAQPPASPICPCIVWGNGPEASLIVGRKREPLLWRLAQAKSGPVHRRRLRTESAAGSYREPQSAATYWSAPDRNDAAEGIDTVFEYAALGQFCADTAQTCYNAPYSLPKYFPWMDAEHSYAIDVLDMIWGPNLGHCVCANKGEACVCSQPRLFQLLQSRKSS